MTRKQLILNLAQWETYETYQRIPFSSNILNGVVTENKASFDIVTCRFR